MLDIFSELDSLRHERNALKHKAARIMQSGDNRRLPGLRRRIEKAEAALETLRQVVLQKQAAERTPARFRKSYGFEMFIEKVPQSRRNKYV